MNLEELISDMMYYDGLEYYEALQIAYTLIEEYECGER